MNYMYYLTFAAMLVTIVVVARLKNSRVGLALQALRDDEIASEAMGIDPVSYTHLRLYGGNAQGRMVEGQPPHADGIQSGEEHPAVLRKVAEQRICTVTSEILFRIWVLKTEKSRYPL